MGGYLGHEVQCKNVQHSEYGKKSSIMYELEKTVLAHVENTPYLGLQISNNLKWGNHKNKNCKKANTSLGFL